MSITKDEIIDAVAGMSVMEVVDLISAMEDKFGVTAAVAAAAPTGGDAGAVVEEQTEFDVILVSGGEKKVNAIKAVRSATGLGLKEAKTLVESVPATVKQGLSKDDAEALKKELEAAGTTVEIK